jgi:arsenite methyltransferase
MEREAKTAEAEKEPMSIIADTKPASPQGRPEATYLELMATFGMSRHSGAWQATAELFELCHAEPGMRILDVGCGIGKTTCYLAKRHGCHAIGVDLSSRMIRWAEETARRERVENKVEFRVADAQDLPFDDGLFDVVINESVLSFVADPEKALREYLRVTKPGGYIGLNESSCLTEPSAEMIAFIDETFVGATLDTVDTWQQRLIGLGLKELVVRAHRLTPRDEVLDRIRWFGCRGLLRNIYYMLSFSVTSSTNRKLLKKLMDANRRVPPAFYEHYAYGIYVGRKAEEAV